MAENATSTRGHGDSTQFSVLVDLFEAVIKAKKGQMKRKHLSTFFNFLGRDYFAAMRLMIPELDKERGNYNLGADKLAKYTADALGLGKDSSDAKKLIEWKRGGARAGKSAGNFALVAFEVLQNRQRETSGGLKIRELNELLDKLVAAEKREGKTAVLTEIINKTNAREMKWIISVILKDLKMGISEKTIFSEFHSDAEDIFNVTCDLRAVCEKLKDRTKRFARQDIEIGKAVRPQLAARVDTVEQAMKKMRGRPVVVECKFDGERIQCHIDGSNLNFFSRNFNDHAEIYRDAIGDDIIKQTKSTKCILDGEIVVWNSVLKSFTPFGTNKTIAKQDTDGVKGDESLCYIIFDILYHDDRSLIHLPLRERHECLKKVVTPLKHRIEVLVPDAELNREPGIQPWTIVPASTEEAQAYFLETVENRDEGVIIKDLESKWEPADRSPNRWAKIKPDYINVDTDLDVLIIGAMYGGGHRRGGQLSNFLLGIAERPKAGGFPTKFHSFCRVGTGFNEEELDALRTKLTPYLRRNERGSKPPSFYVCTGHHKERPDVWVDQPEKSIILQIKSDIRSIQTEVFATPFSLRFPRCQRIRYDKPWYDCLDMETYQDMVLASGGNVLDGSRYSELDGSQHEKKRIKIEKPKLPLVPAHLMGTDVSGVQRKDSIFDGCVFYFANFSPEHGKDAMHRLVVEHGGSFSMNQIDAVTHMVADRKEGPYYQAAIRFGDVIHTSWVFDCINSGELLHVRPKYYLHLSDVTRQSMRSEIDDFGDSYCDNLDTGDLAQLFANMDPNKLHIPAERITRLEDKYDRGMTWGIFRGCHVYMHRPIHSSNEDSQAVAAAVLRRLALDVRMYGGSVSDQITDDTTHMVVYATSDYRVAYETVMRSLTARERALVRDRRIKIVGHLWLEDSGDSQRRVKEAQYLIRSENGDDVDISDEEPVSPPLAISSSDDEDLDPEPESTPSISTLYDLNTRAPPPRSATKSPPSVIKIRSRRDSTGRKITPAAETENLGDPSVTAGGNETTTDIVTSAMVTSAAPDLYELNMRPPPRKGRKQAAGVGGKKRAGKKGGEDEAPMAKPRRGRAARPKLEPVDEKDDFSGEEDVSREGDVSENVATRTAPRPRRAAAVTAARQMTSAEEGSDEEGGLEVRGRGRLRKVGESRDGMLTGEESVPVVKPEPESLNRALTTGGREGTVKEEVDDDVKPDVGSERALVTKEESGARGVPAGRRSGRKGVPNGKGLLEPKPEPEPEPEPRNSRVLAEGRTGNEDGVDEKKTRTRALFTRKRDPQAVRVSQALGAGNETGPWTRVKVKDEPLSQINGGESQIGFETAVVNGHVAGGGSQEEGVGSRLHGANFALRTLGAEAEERTENGTPERNDEKKPSSGAQLANVGLEPLAERTKPEASVSGGSAQDDQKHLAASLEPGSPARPPAEVGEDGSWASTGTGAGRTEEYSAGPKKKRKVNFREQMLAMGL